MPDRKGHDRRYALNIGKATEQLGYAPTVELAKGIATTVAWYRDHRHWWQPLRQRAAGARA